MPNLAEGVYSGTISSTEWFTARTGTVGLNIWVDIPMQDGAMERVKGTIWFSAKTTKPRTRKDGSLGSSQVEEQLRNAGYTGSPSDAREIGYSITIEGTPVRVSVKEDDGDRAQPGDMRVAYFNARQLPKEKLAAALDKVMGNQPAPAAEEGDDDVPSAPAADKVADANAEGDGVPFDRGAAGDGEATQDGPPVAPPSRVPGVERDGNEFTLKGDAMPDQAADAAGDASTGPEGRPQPPPAAPKALIDLQKRADFRLAQARVFLTSQYGKPKMERLVAEIAKAAGLAGPVGACGSSETLTRYMTLLEAALAKAADEDTKGEEKL